MSESENSETILISLAASSSISYQPFPNLQAGLLVKVESVVSPYGTSVLRRTGVETDISSIALSSVRKWTASCQPLLN